MAVKSGFIYVLQPQGFVDAGTSKLVCKLKKCLYGTEQVPKAWHEKISHFFLASGFNIG